MEGVHVSVDVQIEQVNMEQVVAIDDYDEDLRVSENYVHYVL